LSCQRKSAVHRGERNRFCRKSSPLRASVCLLRGLSESVRSKILACAGCAIPASARKRFPAFNSLGVGPGWLKKGFTQQAPCVPLRYALPGQLSGPKAQISWGGESKGEGPQPLPFESLGGVGASRNAPTFLEGPGETGEALPAAEKASLFRGSGTIGGHE